MISIHLENGRVTVEDVPLPERPAGFALIRLLVGGICNTDLELQRGYYGFCGTPGHEFVGEVVEADDAGLVGKRVVGEINLPCWQCGMCLEGLPRHCPRRTVLGIVKHPGAFSEFFTLPERNLHVVPEAISTESAVFTEPLAAACRILEQISIPKGDTVAVLGDGKLGLLIAQFLQASGCQVHQFGRYAEKLRIAEKAGVRTLLADDQTPKAEYGWVVDATGSAAGLQTAIRMTRPCGTVFMKSTVHGALNLDSAAVIVNELTLVGSRCGPFEPALDLLERGAIDVQSMISARFELKDGAAAFEYAARKGAMKVLLTSRT